MDKPDPNLNELILNNILKSSNDEVISEKQSKAEEQAQHQKWREENPEKIRAQVKHHDKKHPRQADQRDKVRQAKENNDGKAAKELGELPKTCQHCGSSNRIQYDHHKGYAKGKASPVRALCIDCHNEAPQQNKPGEKSIEGGTTTTTSITTTTTSESLEKQIDLILEAGDESHGPKRVGGVRKIGKASEGNPNAAKGGARLRFKQHVSPAIKRSESRITLYPHYDHPNILFLYKDKNFLRAFNALRNIPFEETDEVSIKIIDKSSLQPFLLDDAKNHLESRRKQIEAEIKTGLLTKEQGDAQLDQVQKELQSGDLAVPPHIRQYLGQELRGTLQGRVGSNGQFAFSIAGRYLTAGPKAKTQADISNIESQPQITMFNTNWLAPYAKGPYKIDPRIPDDEQRKFLDVSITDPRYLQKTTETIKSLASENELLTKLLPRETESSSQYHDRISPQPLKQQELYSPNDMAGRYFGIEFDKKSKGWRYLANPRADINEIRMLIRIQDDIRPHSIVLKGGKVKRLPPTTLEDLTNPETGERIVIQQPVNYDEEGISKPLITSSELVDDEEEEEAKGEADLIDDDRSKTKGSSVPSLADFRERRKLAFSKYTDEDLLLKFQGLDDLKKKSLKREAATKIAEKMAIAEIGKKKWERLIIIQSGNKIISDADGITIVPLTTPYKPEDSAIMTQASVTRSEAIQAAMAKIESNPERYKPEIKAEILRNLRMDEYASRAQIAIGRKLTCTKCNGKKVINQRDAEAAYIKHYLNSKQKRDARLKLDEDQTKQHYAKLKQRVESLIVQNQELEAAIAKPGEDDQSKLEKTDQIRDNDETIEATKTAISQLKSDLEEIESVRKRLQTSTRAVLPCPDCSGTGEHNVIAGSKGAEPGQEGINIRGLERDEKIKFNLARLNQAISNNYDKKCTACRGSGKDEHDNVVYLKFKQTKNVDEAIPSLANKIKELTDQGIIPIDLWGTIGVTAPVTQDRPSAAGEPPVTGMPPKGMPPGITNIINQQLRDLQGLKRKHTIISPVVQELIRNLEKAQRLTRALPDEESIAVRLYKAFYDKSIITIDNKSNAATAEEVREVLQNISQGFTVWIDQADCQTCKGKGKSTYLSDGMKKMWAQSFNQITTSTYPYSGEFLEKLIGAQKAYEDTFQKQNGKTIVKFGMDTWEIPNGKERFISIRKLIEMISGLNRERCANCYTNGITSEKVDEPDTEGPSYEIEIKGAKPQKRTKLTIDEKESIIKTGESIKLGNQLFEKCTKCEGTGYIGDQSPLDLDTNPIYVLMMEDPYRHYLGEYQRALKSVPQFSKQLTNAEIFLRKLEQLKRGDPEAELVRKAAAEYVPRPIEFTGVAQIIGIKPELDPRETTQPTVANPISKVKKDLESKGLDWDSLPVAEDEWFKALKISDLSSLLGPEAINRIKTVYDSDFKEIYTSTDPVARQIKETIIDRLDYKSPAYNNVIERAQGHKRSNLVYQEIAVQLATQKGQVWSELDQAEKTRWKLKAKTQNVIIQDDLISNMDGKVQVVFRSVQDGHEIVKVYDVDITRRLDPVLIQVTKQAEPRSTVPRRELRPPSRKEKEERKEERREEERKKKLEESKLIDLITDSLDDYYLGRIGIDPKDLAEDLD